MFSLSLVHAWEQQKRIATIQNYVLNYENLYFFLWVCIKILFILMIYICDSSLIRLLLKYLISGCSPSFLLLLFSFLIYSLHAFYITLWLYNRFVSLQNKDRVHYVGIYVTCSYIYIMSMCSYACLDTLLFFAVKVNNLHLFFLKPEPISLI